MKTCLLRDSKIVEPQTVARVAGNTEPLPLDIKDHITHFQKLLAEAADRRGAIPVFDALNQFDAIDGAHCLNWLPRDLLPGVRIVASVIAPADGQPEYQSLAILRRRPGTGLENLELLTEADTLDVIKDCLWRYAKRLSQGISPCSSRRGERYRRLTCATVGQRKELIFIPMTRGESLHGETQFVINGRFSLELRRLDDYVEYPSLDPSADVLHQPQDARTRGRPQVRPSLAR